MNKSVILLCKNRYCNNFKRGDCKRAQVSFAPVSKLTPDKLICEDFEPIPEPEIQKAKDGNKSMQKM